MGQVGKAFRFSDWQLFYRSVEVRACQLSGGLPIGKGGSKVAELRQKVVYLARRFIMERVTGNRVLLSMFVI